MKNLSPLSRFHGQYLAVSPQLQEQAEDLVKAGNFWEFRIEYPEGGWEMDDMDFSLLSLDELETLPPCLPPCCAGSTVSALLATRSSIRTFTRYGMTGSIPMLTTNLVPYFTTGRPMKRHG